MPGLGPRFRAPAEDCEPASFREGMQAIVFFVGQVVINNIDILLVKHFFPPREAGLYAAVALVGRVLYFASWSVVSAMFPVSAAAAKREEDTRSVLAVPILLVSSLSAGFVLLLALFPETLVRLLFGTEFREAVPLFSLYAAATGVYALSVVLVTYEMSRRIAHVGWLQLAFSGLVVAGIYLFHASLWQVVMVQLALMVVLLALVAAPFLRVRRTALPEVA
jgi:O-antigen/teichoic acid export membrane protein